MTSLSAAVNNLNFKKNLYNVRDKKDKLHDNETEPRIYLEDIVLMPQIKF